MVKERGAKNIIRYSIAYSNVRYVVVDNPKVTWEDIMTKYIKNFDLHFVKMFGKCEVECFIAEKMLYAILVTKDITDLFNMDVVCDDFPYNITKVNAKKIQEKCIHLFDIISKKDGEVKLMFKWGEYVKE